jgi:excisionase family DNA binding protein
MIDGLKLMTRQEVADLLGCTKRFLERLHNKGQGPEYFLPAPRTVLYAKSEVLAWLETTRVKAQA